MRATAKLNPHHCYAQCPTLNRTLGFPVSDADGVPQAPPGMLVPVDEATCPDCRAFAASIAPYGDGRTTHGDWLREAWRKEEIK
jgi:hypothetical protein